MGYVLDGVLVSISTHAPRTGSDIINNCTFETIKISTHAPRTGSDFIA